MQYTELPQAIKDISDKLDEINMKYVSYVGWFCGAHYADMDRGDQIRIGKLNAKLFRIIEALGLSDKDVLWSIAQKGSK